jgi:hypothetical protein
LSLIDREGKRLTQLIPKIENAWKEFHSSATTINKKTITEKLHFILLPTTSRAKQIARIGDEFIKLIPYVLALLQKLKRLK